MIEPDATVFLVDADSIARNAIKDLVHSMRLPCAAFSSGAEFLENYDRSQAGCLVTELRIPDISGLQIQRRLREDDDPLPVIFVTAHACVSVVVQAMQAGAVDFFEKPPEEQELWEAIQRAIRVDRKRRRELSERASMKRRLGMLTPKQRDVLRLLAQGKGTRTIAEELDVSTRTIELHRSGAMRKLETKSLAELMCFAFAAYNENSTHVTKQKADATRSSNHQGNGRQLAPGWGI